MKQLLFAISTFLLFSCSSKQHNNTSTAIIEKSYESIKIDTVTYRINAEDSVKCGYYVLKFNYPQIRGISDIELQKRINKALLEEVNPYIKSIKSNINIYNLVHNKEFQPLEGGIENYKEEIPGELYISFDVLSRDSIISIVQYFSEGVGNGGNGRIMSSTIINFHVFKGRILTNSDLNVKSYNINFINEKIKLYFNKCFTNKAEINYPTIENTKELRKLNYAIRNDSIMLVLEATPSANYSYNTYVIPIDKKH